MKVIEKIFAVGYVGTVVLFVCCGLALIVFAAMELWHGVNPVAALPLRERFNAVLESIGLLTIAVVALELGQTVLEEEVRREAQVSAPTRVRRFLSRFMVVVVVGSMTGEDPTRTIRGGPSNTLMRATTPTSENDTPASFAAAASAFPRARALGARRVGSLARLSMTTRVIAAGTFAADGHESSAGGISWRCLIRRPTGCSASNGVRPASIW